MNNLQKAFDGIRAEVELKQNTIDFLCNAIHAKGNPHRKRAIVRYSVAAVCLLIVAFLSLFSYSYFTPSGYIGMDVNPSVELTVNRFDRVIDTQAFNEEGEAVLLDLSLRHKMYSEAAELIMDKITDLGYWQEDALVSVTVQTDDPGRESAMLAAIEVGVNSHIDAHNTSGQVDVFSVDSETLGYAHDEGMSAAKYLAILELQELDPAVTMDECRDHSVGEIRQIIEGHRGEHHGNGNGGGSNNDSSDAAAEDDSGEVSHGEAGQNSGSGRARQRPRKWP